MGSAGLIGAVNCQGGRRGLDVLPLFTYDGGGLVQREAQRLSMKPPKLSRKQLKDALDTVPVSVILGREVNRELTPKQRKFALEVAKGNTKADAYRKAYKADAAPSTILGEPYRVAANPAVSAEIQAIEAAIRAAEYETPAGLRSLVIHSLVKVITDPESKPGQITAAAKVLGSVTEVAAFTERKEIRTIRSSEDTRAQVMAQLREMLKAQADDAEVIDNAADSLLAELSGSRGEVDPTHTPPPAVADMVGRPPTHTIPLERSPHPLDLEDTPPSFSSGTPDPTPSFLGDPPSKLDLPKNEAPTSN
jgi:phage terminase small subunit